jgi:transposase
MPAALPPQVRRAEQGVVEGTAEAQAATTLAAWIRDAEGGGLPPFVRTAATLRKWRVELLNYRRYPLTNAVVEDKHNRVKALKRRAHGHRNQRTFLARILNFVHTD